MSEQQQPIFMEQAEYLDYLRQQQQRNKEAGISTPVAQMNLYQMNKDLVRGLKKMNNMEINRALEKVKQWYEAYINDAPDTYHFALLNHEKHYFTIFQHRYESDDEADAFITEVKDVLVNYYGDHDIRAIDLDNGAVEIWAIWDGEPTVAYLFPYEQGVVYY